MSSGFITRIEYDKDEPYTVIFTTDEERKYKAIENACRFAIGHGKPQFQEVVRCKDCKYSYDDLMGRVCSHGVCVDSIVMDDFFCADGKRKEKNDG